MDAVLPSEQVDTEYDGSASLQSLPIHDELKYAAPNRPDLTLRLNNEGGDGGVKKLDIDSLNGGYGFTLRVGMA